MITCLVEGMADLAVSLGKEEISTGESAILKLLASEGTQLLNEIAKDLTSEQLGELVKIMLNFPPDLADFSNILTLDPDKKVSLGTRLKDSAKDLRGLVKTMEGN